MLSVNLWHIFTVHIDYRLLLFKNKLVTAIISLPYIACVKERVILKFYNFFINDDYRLCMKTFMMRWWNV